MCLRPKPSMSSTCTTWLTRLFCFLLSSRINSTVFSTRYTIAFSISSRVSDDATPAVKHDSAMVQQQGPSPWINRIGYKTRFTERQFTHFVLFFMFFFIKLQAKPMTRYLWCRTCQSDQSVGVCLLCRGPPLRRASTSWPRAPGTSCRAASRCCSVYAMPSTETQAPAARTEQRRVPLHGKYPVLFDVIKTARLHVTLWCFKVSSSVLFCTWFRSRSPESAELK